MLVIPHDHPTGSCTDRRDLAPLQRRFLERFCVEVLRPTCVKDLVLEVLVIVAALKIWDL